MSARAVATSSTACFRNSVVDRSIITSNCHRATGDFHRATGDAHRATGDFHHATGGVHRATVDFHRATGDFHHATGGVHRATGGVHHATGGVHRATGEPLFAQFAVLLQTGKNPDFKKLQIFSAVGHAADFEGRAVADIFGVAINEGLAVGLID